MATNASKVAIATGPSRGIGAAVAKRLAADGFTVVVNYAGAAAPAEALTAKIEKAGGRAITAQADVSDPAAVARPFDAAEAAFGGIDILVNNASSVSARPRTSPTRSPSSPVGTWINGRALRARGGIV